MTQDAHLSPALRAAILAAVAAFEQDQRPVRNLASSSDMWRIHGRRVQMASRFDGRFTIPSLPVETLGWERVARRSME